MIRLILKAVFAAILQSWARAAFADVGHDLLDIPNLLAHMEGFGSVAAVFSAAGLHGLDSLLSSQPNFGREAGQVFASSLLGIAAG